MFEQEFGKLSAEEGRPGTPIRLMAGLTCLGHAYQLSDEEVVRRWVENPYYQYFCGEEYFRHKLPIDPSSLSRWRRRIGEQGGRAHPEAHRPCGPEDQSGATVQPGADYF
jgi:IS5 family transposase